MVSDPVPWLRSVRRSHERSPPRSASYPFPRTATRPMTTSEHRQVLSHLGSQAEIFSLFVEAGLEGTEARPVRLRSDLGQMEQQDCSGAGGRQHRGQRGAPRRLEGLDSEQLTAFRLEMFGWTSTSRPTSDAALRACRPQLDVAVTIDPSAEVTADAVELLIDGLPDLAARAASQPTASSRSPFRRRRPNALPAGARRCATRTGERRATHSVELPAEAFLRLLYGRLDESHPPTATSTPQASPSTNFGRCSRVLSPGSVRRTRPRTRNGREGSTPVLPYSPQAGASCPVSAMEIGVYSFGNVRRRDDGHSLDSGGHFGPPPSHLFRRRRGTRLLRSGRTPHHDDAGVVTEHRARRSRRADEADPPG